MTQALKTWPIYFRAIVEGTKTFEVRKNDRKYRVGDNLLFQEYDPEKEEYTGQEWKGEITYLMDDTSGFVKKGFCIFGIKEKE